MNLACNHRLKLRALADRMGQVDRGAPAARSVMRSP